MSFTVVATAAQRAQIQGMLREICAGASVDANSGEVSVAATLPAGHSEGCDCIRALIASAKQVHIHPLDAPGDQIPGSGIGPNNPKKKIRDCQGGATVAGSLDDAQRKADGTAGPGSNTDVYIDMSNNAGRGYDAPPGTAGRRPPLWLILAHELTSGHAFHCVSGTLPHHVGNKKVDEAARENQAIDSENEHRRAHGLKRRRHQTVDDE